MERLFVEADKNKLNLYQNRKQIFLLSTICYTELERGLQGWVATGIISGEKNTNKEAADVPQINYSK